MHRRSLCICFWVFSPNSLIFYHISVAYFLTTDNFLQTNIPAAVIGDIQSLLVIAMCNTANLYFAKKSSGLALPESTEKNEQSYLLDAAIAFCKLQQLNFNLPIKSQVRCPLTTMNFCLITAPYVSLRNLYSNYF